MSEYIAQLKNDGVGVIPTDTLYGLVGSALSEKAVERVYALRKRDLDKPCIVLISSTDELFPFGIEVTPYLKEQCAQYWPGPVSIVMPVTSDFLAYLHRGTKTVAFRMPKDEKLLALIKEVGPLIAPSANLQGKEPAHTVAEAKDYFGDSVDFYVDGGERNGAPSAVIVFDGPMMKVLRDGAALHTENTGN